MNLEAKPEEMFDLFMESLKFDIEAATDKKPRNQDLKAGFSYEKMLTSRLGKPSAAKATISKLEAPYVYEMKYENFRGINIAIYHIEKVDEDNIEVSYEEVYEGHKKMDNINFKVMSWIFKRSSAKRARLLLEAMGQHILDNRDNATKE